MSGEPPPAAMSETEPNVEGTAPSIDLESQREADQGYEPATSVAEGILVELETD